MHYKQRIIKKSIIACVLMSMLIGVSVYWFVHHTSRPSVYTFNKARDMPSVLALFKKDWHWLVATDDYSPEFMLNYLTPNDDPSYLGSLKIDVLRSGDNLMGFVAYYMESAELGWILFLAVDSKYRRQKNGERLLLHGIDQLKQIGAHQIRLLTRISNLPAQALYKRVGFHELYREEPEGFVYFEYDAAQH